MPTFITLVNFTDQGIKNIKDSPKRAKAFQDLAKKSGCSVKELGSGITSVSFPKKEILRASQTFPLMFQRSWKNFESLKRELLINKRPFVSSSVCMMREMQAK